MLFYPLIVVLLAVLWQFAWTLGDLAVTALLLSVIYITWSYWRLGRLDKGPEALQKLGGHIRAGANTFLVRQYGVLGLVVVVVAAIIYPFLGVKIMLTFLLGAITSAAAGAYGLEIATVANVRACHAAEEGIDPALRAAFLGSSIIGVLVAALALMVVGIGEGLGDVQALFGLSFGASLVALFARVGGGIFTKSADMAADLVGKVEQHIPEDDARNPAVIADNVGDNVGDVAVMSADLFESYVGCLVSALTLGALATGSGGFWLPIDIAGLGLTASILAAFTVRCGKRVSPKGALRVGMIVANILLVIGAAILCFSFPQAWPGFWSVVCGIGAGTGIGLITEFYTSTESRTVKSIAASCETSAANTIIEGLAAGMTSTVFPLLLIACVITLANYILGLYGVALAALGMLATLGTSLAVDAFGPIVDNAGGLAQMAKLPHHVRERTDALDAVGNTTAAIGKGFAIGSAAITSLVFFFIYTERAGLNGINLAKPDVLVGLLVGACIPFAFCSLTMRAVGVGAWQMIDNIRAQFKAEPGILEGTVAPNYNSCIDIATRSALKNMLAPGLVAIGAPVAVRYILGPEPLAGFLAGALATGVLLAIALANAGGAWDNAKKLIESGKHGGTGSPAHDAAVIGDTVGDPLKDTSGPSLNILIKLMSILSLLLV